MIGLDVGTTSAKAIAFDPDGGEHGSGDAGYPLLEPNPGEAVQDPHEVVRAALKAVRSALGGDGRVRGLALSSAMHSLIALDDHDRPISQLITWADSRAAPQAERLRAERPELHARTGTPLHPMAPLAKLVWFREMQPELFARARRWVGIKELIVNRLTGAWVTDLSCASGTGLMSLAQLQWDPEALAAAGVGAEQLSRLVPVTEILEVTAGGLPVPSGTPLVVGAGDGPLADLGLGVVRAGMAACSIGTSGALRLTAERPGIDSAGQLFCYASTPGRWAVGGAINNGGSVLEWVRAALAPDLGPHGESELLQLAATVPPGSEGLIMLPYLLSERAPHWSSLARGAYVGLRHRHTRAHLARAAIEGVCQQLSLVLASIRAGGNEVREIRATGGFARSALWRQMLTDAFGVPVGFAADAQGSAFGAALLGMDALGLVDSIDSAAHRVHIEQTLAPDPSAAAMYAQLLPLFAELYDDLTPAFRVLERING